MTDDLLLKCLLAFILGFLISGMVMGNGFSVGIEEEIDIKIYDDVGELIEEIDIEIDIEEKKKIKKFGIKKYYDKHPNQGDLEFEVITDIVDVWHKSGEKWPGKLPPNNSLHKIENKWNKQKKIHTSNEFKEEFNKLKKKMDEFEAIGVIAMMWKHEYDLHNYNSIRGPNNQEFRGSSTPNGEECKPPRGKRPCNYPAPCTDKGYEVCQKYNCMSNNNDPEECKSCDCIRWPRAGNQPGYWGSSWSESKHYSDRGCCAFWNGPCHQCVCPGFQVLPIGPNNDLFGFCGGDRTTLKPFPP